MAPKTPESKIDDRIVGVVVNPLAEPLAPEELYRRIDNLVGIIREHGCGDLAKRVAQGIADSEYSGRFQNVQTAFPQVTVLRADGVRAFNKQFDIMGATAPDGTAMPDGRMEGRELTALTLAAGKWLADHPGKKPADVPIDQEFLGNYKTSIAMLVGPQEASCKVAPNSTLPLKSKLSDLAKER